MRKCDKAVKNYSYSKNLKFIKDYDEGVNNAVILADHYCINNDIDANIVIPQDLLFISAKEIDEICNISNKYHKCIIICPSKRFDGTNVFMLPKTLDAFITRIFYVGIDSTRYSDSYIKRIFKYCERGFCINVPGLCSKYIKNLSFL